MVTKAPFKRIIQGSFLILAFLVLSITGFALWVLDETHSPKFANDYDWLGGHACPAKNQKELQQKLPAAQNRPDEDLLWAAHVNWIFNRAENHEFPWKSNAIAGISEDETHYRVEVRRTILEMEARHPIMVYPICDSEESWHLLRSSGVTYTIGCATDYPRKKAAHDQGRSDALVWYLKHGAYPVNYQLTPTALYLPSK